jgi:hypothetical protein
MSKLKPHLMTNIYCLFLAKYISAIAPEFSDYFCRREIRALDAVIATGSNNTARYFEYYFKKQTIY